VREVEGKVAFITGGSSGIGRGIAIAFAEAGADVVCAARTASDVEAVAGEIEALGRRALAVPTDVMKTEELDHLVAATVAELGRVDVLVNNAGIATGAPLVRTTLDDWRAHLDVNATGAFLCTRAVLGGMIERGDGRIVTVASVAGLVGARYTAAYSASKHAAIGLMRATAAELAGTGVTANAVCPAYVDTDLTRRTVENIVAKTGRSAEEAEAELKGMTPLGRLLEPGEVAAAVVFLASPEAAAINGQTLVLDGGAIQA
jgi:NAD(P)-dependent dehydrogenase (short-subunit alcohol dehydrogenase family)